MYRNLMYIFAMIYYLKSMIYILIICTTHILTKNKIFLHSFDLNKRDHKRLHYFLFTFCPKDKIT